jgi:hypothetical protein
VEVIRDTNKSLVKKIFWEEDLRDLAYKGDIKMYFKDGLGV